MYTVSAYIKDLQMLDQDSPVLIGCMWTRADVREFIEDNFDKPEEVTNKVTDEMIDDMMCALWSLECIDNFNSEDIETAIWDTFGFD